MILGIQMVGILFGLLMLYFAFIHFKRKEMKNFEFSIWLIIWIFFVFLTIFPNSLDFIASTLNLVRTMDFLTVMGFLFLIGLTYHNYFVTKKNEKNIEKIVREISLKDK